jgi:hypothetical protein
MDTVCNVHCMPANGSACHPRASSLLCVLRGFVIVGDEGNQRATSWGACCPEIVPLPRCCRLNVCTILHAAPRKQKSGTTVAEKRRPFSDHHPCAGLTRACFWAHFLDPLFSAGVPKGSANAAVARGASSGKRSAALKKPRRTFQRRDQRAIH